MKAEIIYRELFKREDNLWINDHCPTYTVPVLPMMTVVDRLATAAVNYQPQLKMIRLSHINLFGWIIVDQSLSLIVKATPIQNNAAKLFLYREEAGLATLIAKATVEYAVAFLQPPQLFTPLHHAQSIIDPYERLFHGPAFYYCKHLKRNEYGASAILCGSNRQIPFSTLNQGLLDGATHTIPHDQLYQWCAELAVNQVGYPAMINQINFFQLPPTGDIKCEVRCRGIFKQSQFVYFDLMLLSGDQVWLTMELVEVLFPLPSRGLGSDPVKRRLFLKDKRYVPDINLSQFSEDHKIAVLTTNEVKLSNWLPGTLESAYQVSGDLVKLTHDIAIKECVASYLKVHPSQIDIINNQYAIDAQHPEHQYSYTCQQDDNKFTVSIDNI